MATTSTWRSGVTPKVTALIIVLAAVVPFLGQPYLTRLVTQFLIYAIAAVSLDLLVGYGGMVSFGHAAFFGIGSYAAAFVVLGSPHDLTISLLAALAAGALLALVIGSLSLRTGGSYFIMITLAFAQMIYYGSVVLGKFGGDDGVRVPRSHLLGFALSNSKSFSCVVLVLFLLVLYLCSRLVRSQFGRTLAGIKDNDSRVRSFGYNSYHYKLVAFCIAGAIAALAGALQAQLNEYASPSTFHWTLSGDFLVMVILGGVGSLAGPIIGAFVFVFLQSAISAYTPFWMLWMAPVLLAVVLFSSGGIGQLLDRLGGKRHG
jgi:branched-chain amino acid transport system permease protein